MPETQVSVTEYEKDDGTQTQYRTTIPKNLAEFFEMDGDTTLNWSAGSAADKLEIEVQRDD
jgi:hypothetical protein